MVVWTIVELALIDGANGAVVQCGIIVSVHVNVTGTDDIVTVHVGTIVCVFTNSAMPTQHVLYAVAVGITLSVNAIPTAGANDAVVHLGIIVCVRVELAEIVDGMRLVVVQPGTTVSHTPNKLNVPLIT